MESLPDWIARHALLIWAVVLILALIVGDLCCRGALRRRVAAGHRDHPALQPRTAAILLVLFGASFVLLTWAVWAHTALTGFDAALAQALHDRLSHGVLRVVAPVTNIGKPALLMVFGAVVALWLAVKRNWPLLVPWCVALGGTAVCGEVVKHAVKRVRPFDGHAFMVDTGYSFPSGHAMMSTVFFGMLAYLLLRQPRHHRAIVAIAVALVTIVSISRVVLQAHYFSDVLAACILGAFWLVVGMALAERLRRNAR